MGEPVLLGAASSDLGRSAVQLAKAAVFESLCDKLPEVLFEYVKPPGALRVFEHNSGPVVTDAAAELDNRACAGIGMAAEKVSEAFQVTYKSK